MSTLYKVIFIDMFNQRSFGGDYANYNHALIIARGIVGNGLKSDWQIIRISDGVILAQSVAAQS